MMLANKPNGYSSSVANTSEKEVSDFSESEANDGGNRVESAQPDLVVARDESKWVWRMRLLVAFVLMFAMIAVCVGVYIDGRNSEQENFEKDFEGLVDKLVVSFESMVKQRFGAIDLFFSDVTVSANESWPFVTPPEYTRRMKAVHEMAALFLSSVLVRVTDDQRTEWEEYAVANQDWKRDGMAFSMGMDPADIVAAPIPPTIMDKDTFPDEIVVDQGPGPYFVMWTMHPVTNSTMPSKNMYRDPEHRPIMDYVVANRRPAFGASSDYTDPGTPKVGRYIRFQQADNWEYQDDPVAFLQYPIYDKLGEDRSVVAIFFTTVYWRTYFNGLLPNGADGIYVILENTCGQQYTYQVDGLEARFVGRGDLHSSEYDYLSRQSNIDLIFDYEPGTAGQDDDPSCHYSIRVYPSDEFRNRYETSEPLLFAIILAAVFVFTAAFFLLYDFMVERRQKAVMKSALQSGKLVHSLFPEAVRDRLYEEQEAKSKAATWEAEGNNNGVVDQKQAIASEYPGTTIFFADIVGFTKWSATRTPVEVFQLLEALYGEFDTIANKRGVFKVETIGDCYVAVTGLPNPQERHAEIMVKFSVDCLAKMRNVILSLVDSLGEDTENLSMRVGLHSGPVTGGVLRGQKSRFQLFGDTVNTASRMESNGMSGKIHVSQSTADELVKLGRSTWLAACDEKLPVKGKGDMQTYFVQPSSLTMSVSRHSSSYN
ncbi:unnamed protein product [Cylindrotheca closterium]|uniref:Guanylate cyclase domain-containing protein n=1 Tax=Cylindrotheca closterium TaxID=2856 RepID=A0AAD2FSA8_9STRA|nr:unnamed protein product [Cylindrotheca closterium]